MSGLSANAPAAHNSRTHPRMTFASSGTISPGATAARALGWFRTPCSRPLAHVGLNEAEAKRQGVAARVAKLAMKAVRRTATTDETRGFMKVFLSVRAMTAFSALR